MNQIAFIYAKGEGKSKITGTYNGKNYVCSVTIIDTIIHASATSLVVNSDLL